MKTKLEKCVICGEYFTSTHYNQKCCDSPDCKKELRRLSNRRAKARRDRLQKENVLTKVNTLTEDAIAAREYGMTYGEYKAMQLKGAVL